MFASQSVPLREEKRALADYGLGLGGMALVVTTDGYIRALIS